MCPHVLLDKIELTVCIATPNCCAISLCVRFVVPYKLLISITSLSLSFALTLSLPFDRFPITILARPFLSLSSEFSFGVPINR